jgi:hypothetical protein
MSTVDEKPRTPSTAPRTSGLDHFRRWKAQLAFAISGHPDLAAKARKLGIEVPDTQGTA